MKQLVLKILAITVILMALILSMTITVVDTRPYRETDFYQEMSGRLDSLNEYFQLVELSDQLNIGWSKVNITPNQKTPLAGFGARDPMEMDGILDSSFVRTIVFTKGDEKIALISADLLIIHPVLRNRIFNALPSGWKPGEIYFTATHTHSGQGAWAPGMVGRLFAGEYDPDAVERIAKSVIESITNATQNIAPGMIAVGELSVDHLVRNRLVKDEGIEDPWLKTMILYRGDEQAVFTSFSAHATCYGPDNHQLTGDYPTSFNQLMESDQNISLSLFAAGAVGSMAVDVQNQEPAEMAHTMATQMKEQLELLNMIGLSVQPNPTFKSFRLKLPLRDPYFKLTNNLAIRPYLFEKAFGDFRNDLSVMILGKAIFIGLPCDFSGELAVPLYEKARSLGYQLFITSFNGGYTGYVVKDEWYNLKKYEARSMSWYGPDMGSYLSEIVEQIIETIDETNQAHTSD
ncbi:MAG: neutral/alkaline non-lysosomal ceramidase N-terminal domain-containing protein [Marinoscillum sp.]